MSRELRLATKVQILLDAIVQWKCPACGGTGKYHHRGWVPEASYQKDARATFVNMIVPCKKCEGHGLHPIAKQAIDLTNK